MSQDGADLGYTASQGLSAVMGGEQPSRSMTVAEMDAYLSSEVADADRAAGLYVGASISRGPDDRFESHGSTSSIRDDAPRLLALLEDEGGWRLVR
jgi:hypothetical protein